MVTTHIYIYVLLYIVDSTEIHYIDFGRKRRQVRRGEARYGEGRAERAGDL